MQAVAYSNVRNNLKSFMKKVNNDADVVYITSQNQEENAVLISQTEYENMLENMYLRASSSNRQRLDDSIARLNKGMGTTHAIDET